MDDFFLNNLYLMGFSIVIVWGIIVKSRAIKNSKLKRAVRIISVLMIFPIAFIGHPILITQVWMYLVISIKNIEVGYFLAGAIPMALVMIIGVYAFPYKSSKETEEQEEQNNFKE